MKGEVGALCCDNKTVWSDNMYPEQLKNRAVHVTARCWHFDVVLENERAEQRKRGAQLGRILDALENLTRCDQTHDGFVWPT